MGEIYALPIFRLISQRHIASLMNFVKAELAILKG
jgi:hypothetical protein